MQIDPLETIITWLETALTDAGGRVSGKHRYGEGWTEAQTGVSVHLDGGDEDLYAPVATPRLELGIYAPADGEGQIKIVTLWRALKALSRGNERFTVATSRGVALVHYFKPVASLSILYDDALKMDRGVAFFEAMVAEEAVA